MKLCVYVHSSVNPMEEKRKKIRHDVWCIADHSQRVSSSSIPGKKKIRKPLLYIYFFLFKSIKIGRFFEWYTRTQHLARRDIRVTDSFLLFSSSCRHLSKYLLFRGVGQVRLGARWKGYNRASGAAITKNTAKGEQTSPNIQNTLLEKFWRILLCVIKDDNSKLYVT